MHGTNWYGNGMFGFSFFGLIILIGLVILVVWVVKNGSSEKSNQANNALDILKYRLAKGEISEEEYDRLKNKINE
ncbi:SHOCT domain-containing protein [Paraliobacillus salinarum]|uniref:SHOCT domain-containing protein n=1 Tax=Paraliobacillus salinarum TaxID=1158996 RepID=UPI0015F5B82B|nr:SHOCT domain-containing protein [Paraliobacillus salinarum]